MTDRELLELAAKAAGYDFEGHTKSGNGIYLIGVDHPWRPLTDDGDALRLAVDLGMCVSHWPKHNPPDVMVGYSTGENHGANWIEDYGDNKYAATRRAIVRAAAEIGKAML